MASVMTVEKEAAAFCVTPSISSAPQVGQKAVFQIKLCHFSSLAPLGAHQALASFSTFFESLTCSWASEWE